MNRFLLGIFFGLLLAKYGPKLVEQLRERCQEAMEAHRQPLAPAKEEARP
ncbi:MAG: hypothetical protein HY687_04090 [Chloroflexi bacterium]|nr:hypothetical protein [Chloroflexota bacterium]